MNSLLNNLFAGRDLVIATKHKKESVIAPILEKELGVTCFVAKNFDSDKLGAFSGEIERTKSAIETVKEKCLLAMEANNCDLGIASEGSFGPHPTLFFVPADDELVILIDKKNELEIIARKLSTETNFSHKELTNQAELQEFLIEVDFPAHGVLLKTNSTGKSRVYKDFENTNQLIHIYNELVDKAELVTVETDMRAMRNPKRMKVIEQATHLLIKQIKSICPSCDTPGFSVAEIKKGLPCESCGLPTNSTLSHIYSCKSCNYSVEKMHPNKQKTEEPMYCNYCNP